MISYKFLYLRVDNHLKKKTLRIWVRNMRTKFFHLFVWSSKKYFVGSFFVPASAQPILKGPAEHAKVPAGVPEDNCVLNVCRSCSQPPIASKSGSFPPERPGLDNITTQPLSDATCHRTTFSNVSVSLVTLFSLKRQDKVLEKRWYGGRLRQTMVESWYCQVLVVPEETSQVSRRLEVGNKNSTLSTPGYLLALMRDLSCVSRALTQVAEPNQVRKTNRIRILYQI